MSKDFSNILFWIQYTGGIKNKTLNEEIQLKGRLKLNIITLGLNVENKSPILEFNIKFFEI